MLKADKVKEVLKSFPQGLYILLGIQAGNDGEFLFIEFSQVIYEQ